MHWHAEFHAVSFCLSHYLLAVDISVHHLQNCGNNGALFSRPTSEVLWWYVHSCTHRCCTFARMISGARWPRRPTYVVASFLLLQLPQSGMTSYRNCETQTLGNSLSITLRAGYSSVHTAGGVSETVTEGVLYKWTYWLTVKIVISSNSKSPVSHWLLNISLGDLEWPSLHTMLIWHGPALWNYNALSTNHM